ncbi:MAG TPA: hypothetical protein VHL79_15925 [Ramlibacter sp.]|jgi:hypothetical protein|nr:hypothetical protein [Ramlibacter sp.]
MVATLPLLLAAVLLTPASALAQQQPAAGTYVTTGGWGTLKIEPDGAFTLETLGANGHSCGLDGRIVRGRATLEDNCVLRFDRKAAAIHVAPLSATDTARQACRAFCGARAHFEGDYHPRPPACADDAVQAERARFLVDYRARRYPDAAARLEQVLARCGRSLWWMTDAEVRNDLALAQHRAGRAAACAATLKPLDRLLAGDVHFPPLEREWADAFLPQVRFNRSLCAAPRP